MIAAARDLSARKRGRRSRMGLPGNPDPIRVIRVPSMIRVIRGIRVPSMIRVIRGIRVPSMIRVIRGIRVP